MSSKVPRPTISRFGLSRIILGVFGCMALIWGVVTFPAFWREASIERVASHIIAGEPYRNETLLRHMTVVQAAEASDHCRPGAVWSAAVIRLRMAERYESDNPGKSLDTQQSKELDDAVRGALSCSPSDPFLWIALYWIELKNHGSNEPAYLQMSYRLGPNEGWIALKRNTVAFTNFGQLSTDLKEQALNEYIRLLASKQFFAEAADILVGPAWKVHDLILSRTATLSERDRQIFAQVLQSKGYDISVPGIRLQNHN